MNNNGKNGHKGHVYYFEPNDKDYGYDSNGGVVPLMPHLEDLCVSMSLTAEIRSRDPKNSNLIEKTIAWVSYPNSGNSNKPLAEQIVNGGVNFGGENYLTTYYTEISAEKYIDKEIVEGLGVTNVNISFDSWYTPTITIDFVDVHGSALWGREEAIHDNGEITSDNLLGVFFTQPYPLFRLQVKGFLGSDVTYQLTVSSLKGRYNSQTGNFEVTVQFIGYTYSLLADIPLKCLSYVSEMSYVGKKYWDDNVKNNPQWQMINADSSRTPPIKLYKLIDRIKNAVEIFEGENSRTCDDTETQTTSAPVGAKDNTQDNSIVSLNEAQTVTDANNILNTIGNIETLYNDFIKELISDIKNKNGGNVILGSHIPSNGLTQYQALLLVRVDDNHKFTLNTKTCEAYQKFRVGLNKYNDENPSLKINNSIAALDKVFDKTMPRTSDTIWTTHADKIFTVFNGVVNAPIKYTDIKFGTKTRKLFQETANLLQRDVSFFTIANRGVDVKSDSVQVQYRLNNNLPQGNDKLPITKGAVWAYLLPLGTTKTEIERKRGEIEHTAQNIEINTENKVIGQTTSAESLSDEEQETRKKRIIDILGFEPTIGNFVKLMMCHLETFVEVMKVCGDKITDSIERGDRTYGSLGITIDKTDIARGIKPYPWPALYREGHKEANEVTSNGNQKGDGYEVLGWPNDFQNDGEFWEEQKVVQSIIDAITKYGEEGVGDSSKPLYSYSGLPMSAIDMNTTVSPFRDVIRHINSIETLTPYVGLRAANIIGVGNSKCTSEMAETIGYMDAINLLSVTTNFDKLNEAIQPKDTNVSFEQQVVNYLTCDSKTKPTNEGNNGVKYNNFETIRSGAGNYYHDNRHPMFVGNSANGYTYSYIYTKSAIGGDRPISIIPSELLPFENDNNPYSIIFDGNSETVNNGGVTTTEYNFSFSAKGTIHNSKKTGVAQDFINICNTNKLPQTVGVTDYTNDKLFYIDNNINTAKTFVKQIMDYQNGEVKINDYIIKGGNNDDNVKKFFKNSYKTSIAEYTSLYKEYRLLIPSLQSLDKTYSNQHLSISSETSNDVYYNDEWFNTNSSFYNDVIFADLNDKTKELASSGIDDGLYIRELLVKVNNTEQSLFGSKFYYQQNMSQDMDNVNGFSETNVSDKCKGYLVLSSFMNALDVDRNSVFKKTDTSFTQYIQPCYVLFLGALLWRKRYWERFNQEPLITTGFEQSIPDAETSFITKSENKFYIGTNNKAECFNISDYIAEYDKIDILVKNKLINIFEKFVLGGELGTIMQYCELKSKLVSNEDNRWDVWTSAWSANDFDTKQVSQWGNIFTNIFGNYTSIVRTVDSKGLRLLFNENNKAMPILKSLYGLNGGYIVSKSTTNLIGQGENEVKITDSQLKGYLRGFKKRITEAQASVQKTEETETVQPNTLVDRNMAVSLYYSLKHLWDTWLLTAGRKEFTIENFFNKHFIFIDSFYINMYNVIKLNAENILNAYMRDETNLLSFITNVVSEEKCMFYSLPTFLDSNLQSNGDSNVSSYNFAWDKGSLDNVFTPLSYNQMGLPQTTNTFVFIYTHGLSNNASEHTDYTFDSYDMKDDDNRPIALNVDMIPKKNGVGADDYNDYYRRLMPNNSVPTEMDELVSARYGYVMPCFGVTVNRGNNYIFKSINVNMDSPKVTNVAAHTLEDILVKYGADQTKKIHFYGQDIFSIYSQYSYACEIEMLGCVQIQPLMYFQLLNIPMWRGTYMIHKVTHSMQAGMMTTKFVGIKMSRKQNPYANGYFTLPKRISISDKSQTSVGGKTYVNLSPSGKYAVGGDAMIQRIFGDYTGFVVSHNYDVPRGVKENGKPHWHCGIDIKAPEGTPLYAPWDGEVKFVRYGSKSAGNYLMFTDSTGTYSVVYMHCKEIKVKKGDVLNADSVLALVGKTGSNAVTGEPVKAHLHLELHTDGSYVIGQSKRNGGVAKHVNPSINIGYLGSDE